MEIENTKDILVYDLLTTICKFTNKDFTYKWMEIEEKYNQLINISDFKTFKKTLLKHIEQGLVSIDQNLETEKPMLWTTKNYIVFGNWFLDNMNHRLNLNQIAMIDCFYTVKCYYKGLQLDKDSAKQYLYNKISFLRALKNTSFCHEAELLEKEVKKEE